MNSMEEYRKISLDDIERLGPMEIERRSFEIISEEAGGRIPDDIRAMIIKRVIHTSADFEYIDNLCFSDGAVEHALEALKNGAWIVTDTNMALSGINKKSLQKAGGEAHCFIADEDVAEEAKRLGVTRASVCVDKAAKLERPLIYAVGNAPTALVRLYELIQEGKIRPELIIGVPVGFVNVVQSKELIMQTDIPYIVARGRKGGSNVAACICNALLYLLDGSRR
ncbi:MAG: precorrin-8X methylmutase [Lachnospiraceae bacterium]|nr:precorrin-8X methylmutase [Lachnospiraceae bacterium]